MTGKNLIEMYNLLLNYFGPQNWWPAETELEVMIGAILTQNTNWKNVEKAIFNLKNRNLLSIDSLFSLPVSSLAREIRSAGYYNVKAQRLKNLIEFIVERYEGNLSLLFRIETETLRKELLSIKGIGPETADSMLLYAAGRPVFVIDAYTHRILNRHGMSEDQTTYYELQSLFVSHLPEDVSLFNEFHALIVQAGKNFCRRKPHCMRCPLEEWGIIPPIID